MVLLTNPEMITESESSPKEDSTVQFGYVMKAKPTFNILMDLLSRIPRMLKVIRWYISARKTGKIYLLLVIPPTLLVSFMVGGWLMGQKHIRPAKVLR